MRRCFRLPTWMSQNVSKEVFLTYQSFMRKLQVVLEIIFLGNEECTPRSSHSHPILRTNCLEENTSYYQVLQESIKKKNIRKTFAIKIIQRKFCISREKTFVIQSGSIFRGIKHSLICQYSYFHYNNQALKHHSVLKWQLLKINLISFIFSQVSLVLSRNILTKVF